MAYIGKTPTSGDFVLLDSITTSATASYTMQKNSVNFEPQSANHMILSLNGTIQAPISSFTVSGSTLTFASALTSSDVIDFILVLGNVNDVGTATTVVDSAITKNKLNLISESSSAGLTVKGDGSSENGTIQLNCSQNSHGVKISSPAHSAGQSYELILPTGNVTADKFLKVASVSGSGTTGIGQLSFDDAGGGDLVKLTQANSTTDVSVVNIDSIFSSIYSAYRVVGTFKSTNSDVDAYFRWRASSSDLSVSQYYASARGGYVNGSGAGAQSISDWGTSYTRVAKSLKNNNYNALHLDMLLYPYNNTGVGNISSIDNASTGIFHTQYWHDAASERQEQISGGFSYTQTTVPDGFALYPSAGDWDGYNYAVFGYKG